MEKPAISRHVVALVVICGLVSACANIPQGAVDLNRKVSKGVEALAENARSVIGTWRSLTYEIVDRNHDEIFGEVKINHTNKLKNKLKAMHPGASKEELRSALESALALLHARVRDKIRAGIDTKADAMLAVVNKNTRAILKANDSITNLLVSSREVVASRNALLVDFEALIPIPPPAKEFVKTLIAGTAGAK